MSVDELVGVAFTRERRQHGGLSAQHVLAVDAFIPSKRLVREVGWDVRSVEVSAATKYAYNENNQLCWKINQAVTNTTCANPPANATLFTYDDAGNQTGFSLGPSTTWDAKGRIDLFGSGYSSILSPNNNELVGLGSDTYTNTALGVSRITTGGTTAKLVREPEAATVVSQVKGTDKSWFVTDQIGSTTALISSTGAVQRTYNYDIDGVELAGTGSGPTTNIKFAGGHDVGNGIYHFGARYYQPSIGRWTQMDPLLQPTDLGQANRYTYVGNDPVNATDPSGMIIDPCNMVGLCKQLRSARKTVQRTVTKCGAGALASVGGTAIVGGGKAMWFQDATSGKFIKKDARAAALYGCAAGVGVPLP